ncbi:isoprenylcysteine carboxylmethyltransferase family protein [Methanosarcina horonobensis]
MEGDPHLNLIHFISYIFILGGLYLLSSAWDVLYKARKNHELATTGPYAYVCHPQYDGFILVMIGFLIQWPTILTLIMFPIFVYMYKRLAKVRKKRHWRSLVKHIPAIWQKFRGLYHI